MSDALKSGNFQERGLALLNRLRVLRQAYQSGFFTAPTTLPLPEIVADGQGPDDWFGGSPHGAPSTDPSCRRDSTCEPALPNRLRALRQAYQSGFFRAPTTLPLPEIVADGHGPDDWLAGPQEGAPSTERSGRRDWPFRVAPDLQGRPFCPSCGVLHDSLGDPCPVCEES